MAGPVDTDPLLQIINQGRLAVWTQYPGLSEQERERIWSQRQVELASLLIAGNELGGSTRPGSHVPRSMSSGSFCSTRLATNPQAPRAMNRQQDLSAISAPAAVSMSRTSSTISGTTSQSRTAPHYILSSSARTHGRDEPFSAYTATSSAGGFSDSGLGPLAQQHGDINVDVYEPAEYVSTIPDTFGSLLVPSAPGPASRMQVQQPATASDDTQPPWTASWLDGTLSPSLSSNGELTIGSSAASPMSRDNSIAKTSLSDAFDMIKVDSTFSRRSDLFPSIGDNTSEFLAANPTDTLTKSLDENNFANTPNIPMNNPSSNHVTPATTFHRPSQTFADEDLEDMQDFISSESTLSPPSFQMNTRAYRRRQEQIAQGARPIAPKELEKKASALSEQATADHKMLRVRTDYGTSREVAAITRAPYVRPTHPKTKCKYCNAYPEGFRGEHELRRHTDREHGKTRKVWITQDRSRDSKFLSNCKACRNGKRYGVYYNAAAHLRRAHFNPRKRGRKAKGDEKRGGKAGGDWPPMDVLKSEGWLKEIEELVPENSTATPASDMDDDMGELSSESIVDSFGGFASQQTPVNVDVACAAGVADGPFGSSNLADMELTQFGDSFVYPGAYAPANDQLQLAAYTSLDAYAPQ